MAGGRGRGFAQALTVDVQDRSRVSVQFSITTERCFLLSVRQRVVFSFSFSLTLNIFHFVRSHIGPSLGFGLCGFIFLTFSLSLEQGEEQMKARSPLGSRALLRSSLT